MGGREHVLKVRTSEEELQRIQKRAKELGIHNVSAYIRRMALNGYIFRIDMSDFREILRLVSISSNNLNQYARRANETGSIYQKDIRQLQESQKEIIGLLKKLLERFNGIS